MGAPSRELERVRDRIFDRLARGQLLVLVGAGASRWAGLPSWRQAVCALAEDLVPALSEHVPDAKARFAAPHSDAAVPVLELGVSTDLERATVEMDRILRVDLHASNTEHPPELLELLGVLVARCERELGPRT
jgi:hypothetical protein